MIVVTISFLFGIYWGRYLKDIASFFAINCCVGIILYLRNKMSLFLIFFTLAMFGFGYINYCENRYESFYNLTDINMELTIVKEKNESKYNYIYIAKGKKGIYLELYFSKKMPKYKVGDIIFVEGEYQEPKEATNEDNFNYKEYLKQKKIYGSVKINQCKLIGNKKVLNELGKIKNKLENFLKERYLKEAYEFLNTMLLGNTMDSEIKEMFSKSNLSHILAISGMHISYIVLLVDKVLKKIKTNKKVKNLVIIILLSIYLTFIDYPISATRAIIMQTISLLAFCLNRKDNFYNNFAITIFILLLMNPYNIESIAMWLSMGGIFGIYLYSKFLNKAFVSKIKNKGINKIKIFFIKNIILNISVQLIIFPIIWSSFYTIPVFSLFLNIFILPLIPICLLLGYISFCEIFIKIKCVSSVNNLITLLLLKYIKSISSLPLITIFRKKPSKILIISYFLIMFILVLKFKKSSIKEFLNLYKIFKKKRNKYLIKFLDSKILFCIFIIVLNFALLCYSLFSNYFFRKNIDIYFLDVGQGDCTVIKTEKNDFIIIDGGEEENGKNVLFPFLINKGAKKIDFLVISHCDSDHIAGLFYLMENMRIENIVIGKQYEMTENLEQLIELAKNHKINIINVIQGNNIVAEKNLYLEILWPTDKLISDNAINNNSLVIKLKYNSFSMLFTGDIEKVAEEAILKQGIDLKADILKVAHHRF